VTDSRKARDPRGLAAAVPVGERGAGEHHPIGMVTWGMVVGENLRPVQIAGMVVLLSGAALVQVATHGPVTPADPLPTE
jgi:hypothetical protein